jgi:catechol 2,3-dioxygenase-like lactoylglutathione lyase family enzyme
MNCNTTINHLALQFSDKDEAETFFTKILEMPKVKTFTLSKHLSDAIFGIKRNVEVEVYENGIARFEIFIGETRKKSGCEHVCIEVQDKEEFIARCKKYDLEPLIIKKEDKELLFVKDFSNNLYEVKEKLFH